MSDIAILLCLTASPYPNIAMSTDLILGTMTVKADGMMAAHQTSKFMKSTGDEPGVAGGLMSMVFIGEASFVSFSPTVMMNGKPVCRLTDKMLMNKGNTVCMAGVLQPPLPPSTPLMTMAPPAEPKFCTVQEFEVECKHKGLRKFHLDAFTQPGAFLKVIATDASPEKIGLKVKGKCGYGSAKCPTPVLVSLDGKEVMPPGTTSVELQLPESGRAPWAGYLLAGQRHPFSVADRFGDLSSPGSLLRRRQTRAGGVRRLCRGLSQLQVERQHQRQLRARQEEH